MKDESRLWTEGFVFEKIIFHWTEVEDWMNDSLYDEMPIHREGYDVPLRWENISKSVIKGITDQLYPKIPEGFRHLLEDMNWDAHMMKKGDYIKMHSDAGEGGIFQILVWISEHNAFKGREFIYGEEDHLMERKPECGLVCIMNTADPKFIHGVKPLLSDDKVVTITGYF